MKTLADLKVGDTVWIVDEANGRNRPPKPIKVTKIGTRLIEVEGTRGNKYRKDTMRINDEYGHWKLIIDLQEYHDGILKKKLISAIRNGMWEDVSLDDVKMIAKLVGVSDEC